MKSWPPADCGGVGVIPTNFPGGVVAVVVPVPVLVPVAVVPPAPPYFASFGYPVRARSSEISLDRSPSYTPVFARYAAMAFSRFLISASSAARDDADRPGCVRSEERRVGQECR